MNDFEFRQQFGQFSKGLTKLNQSSKCNQNAAEAEKTAEKDRELAQNATTPPPSPSPSEGDQKGDDQSKKGDDDQSKKGDDDQSKKQPTTDDDEKKGKPDSEDGTKVEGGDGGFSAGSTFVAILFGMALMFGLIKMYVFWEKRRDLDPPNYRVKEFKVKSNQQIRDVQTLIYQLESQLSDNGEENNWKKTLELSASLLEIECKMVKLDNENAIKLVELKDYAMNFCDAHNMAKLNGKKLINNVKMAFEKEGTKMVEEMRRAEITVKVSVDGVYGTLAEVLSKKHPKSPNLRTYVAVTNLLHTINRKMEVGTAKDAIAKLLNRDTVTREGTATVMPSDLIELIMTLWHFVYQNEKKESAIQNQPFDVDRANDAQLFRPPGHAHQQFDQQVQHVRHAVLARRRRRRSLHLTRRQLLNIFRATIAAILAMNLLRLTLRTMADQLDQPPIFMLAVLGTIQYFMTLD
uniref:Uncharacterized protein n=1 Tax=Globodera rostochiensis TaxID=31243 RepID=A0A914I488_GLORO